MKNEEATVVIRTYSTRQAAEFAQMLLEGSGITSFINADDAGGMRPYMAMTGVQLIVRTDELARADDVLKDSESRGSV